MKWKHFPRYWIFVWRIHRSPVDSPHKGQWCGTVMFSLICTWTNTWANNPDPSDLRRLCTHYDITAMKFNTLYMNKQMPVVDNIFKHIFFKKMISLQSTFHWLLSFSWVPLTISHNGLSLNSLTHLPLDKMAAILQTIYSDAFLWMKNFVLWLKSYWSVFLSVQLTINQHWFR